MIVEITLNDVTEEELTNGLDPEELAEIESARKSVEDGDDCMEDDGR